MHTITFVQLEGVAVFAIQSSDPQHNAETTFLH